MLIVLRTRFAHISFGNFRYENECIFAKESVNARPMRLNFNRMKCKQLYDMKVKSQDGQIFNVHKCILVARMEYFRLMLSGYWKEVGTKICAFRYKNTRGYIIYGLLYLLLVGG